MAKNSQEVLDELQKQNEESSTDSNPQNENPAPSNEGTSERPASKESSVFSKFDGYKPNEDEEHLYHVGIAKVHYSESSGEYDGQTPYVQKFIKRDYDNFMKHAKALGYTTKLLYSPINA